MKNRYEEFKKLHETLENTLYLFNCWDVSSAKLVEQKGVKAIATSSYAAADHLGFQDGEKLPFELLIALANNLVQSVNIPVTIDAEGMYAEQLEELKEKGNLLFQTGISGINFEDQKIKSHSYALFSVNEQYDRIEALKEAARQLNLSIFINARTDIFLKNKEHSIKVVEEAIERAQAYHEAGAECIFVPGLTDLSLIEKFAKNASLPVNVMRDAQVPEKIDWASLGIQRVSYGPSPYVEAMRVGTQNLNIRV